MSSPANRTIRTAMIPWVIVLVALFGLNAVAPDHSPAKKSEPSGGIELSQLGDTAQTPGRIFNPLVFLVPTPSAEIGLLYSSSLFLCIETRRDLAVVQSLRGAVQGRAPPVTLHS